MIQESTIIKRVRALFRRQKPTLEIKSHPVELATDDICEIDHIIGARLTMASRERLYCTALACNHVADNRIPGAFVECGVWRGGNSLLAASIFRRRQVKERVYLFDTFEGMTAPTSNDYELGSGTAAIIKYQAMHAGEINQWCYSPATAVRSVFSSRGFTDETISIVQGDVNVTLMDETNLPSQISVLRLDTDWYDSTLLELKVLFPRLVPGGILIIDDYGHWAGSKKAVDEYFCSNPPRPFFQYTDYTGRAAVKP